MEADLDRDMFSLPAAPVSHGVATLASLIGLQPREYGALEKALEAQQARMNSRDSSEQGTSLYKIEKSYGRKVY